jgi:hypothetical protein
MWLHTVEHSTQSSAICFHMELCSDFSMEATIAARITIQDTGSPHQTKFFIFRFEKTHFFP